jgi:hypothetical protein
MCLACLPIHTVTDSRSAATVEYLAHAVTHTHIRTHARKHAWNLSLGLFGSL